MKYVVAEEQWHGGLAVGYLWSRIVCSASNGEVAELNGTSEYAETLASFSTINQEKRHETLPSWYHLICFVLIKGCLRKRLSGGCGMRRIDYS